LGLRGRARLFSDEIRSALTGLNGLGADLAEKAARSAVPLEQPATLAAAPLRYQELSRLLLLEPLERFEELRPIRRALEARQELDHDLLEMAREGEISAEPVEQALRQRMDLDKRLHELLASACLDLREPWRLMRAGRAAQEPQAWEQRRAARGREAETVLAEVTRWAEELPARMRHAAEVRPVRANGLTAVLWRQQRAVRAELLLDREACLLAETWLQQASRLARGLREEREALQSAARRVKAWVELGAPEEDGRGTGDLALSSLDERVDQFRRILIEETSRLMPEKVEFVTPGRRVRWRTAHPRQAFLSAAAGQGPERIKAIFVRHWETSADLLRDIERAREVVEYWRSVGQKEGMWEEALRNAAATLAAGMETDEPAEAMDPQALASFREWEHDAWAVLEAGQLGWWRILTEQRGRRLAGTAFSASRRAARARMGRLRGHLRNARDHLLEWIGWKAPQRLVAAAVERRRTLRDTLGLPAAADELPGIYRTLFRLTALEDPRLLVGRDEEMRGIAQALDDWQSGRFAACLIMGSRGSGKTSLLNCAVAELFQDCEVIRGLFSGRILNAVELDSFLRKLLRLDDSGDLERAFADRRRIVVLEEVERTYLRKTGGFDGIRRLAHWIQHSAKTTLWLVAGNDRGFQVMDKAVELGGLFSHRINAMNVTRQDLELAVLARHRLSGLRLRFAPPPRGDPRISRARQFLGWEATPQQLFFDSLYEQSGGVFRSAFELWRNSVERTEGETVEMRHPLPPDFAPVRRGLGQADHFTLLAIQQHGSVKADELAEILCEGVGDSIARMERLTSMGLLEQDPEHPGIRVRPEAQAFVNDLLRRLNLV